MGFLDVFTIVVYLASMLLIGFMANRRQKSMEDYYVAGRRMGVFSVASLWLSSWVGGASVVGASGKAYDMGITAIWYVGIMAVGLLAFGLTFPALVKNVGDKLKNITYPDLIEARYGTPSRVAATVTTILAYIAYTASQFVAAGAILHVMTGWSTGVSFLVAAVITTAYTTAGGYLAVTYTDLVQVILLLVGIAFLGVPLAMHDMAAAGTGIASLPARYFDIGAWGWPSIAALGVSMIFSFFTSMDSYTRCFAARDAKTARRGALLAIAGILIIAVSSTYLGLAAKVLLPDLVSGDNSLTELIIRLFPAGLRGLVLVGILAAIMSTGDICVLTASANVTNDIYHRFLNRDASDKKLLRMGMAVSLCVGVVSALFAWYMGDIISILFVAFTINSAGLFLPTVLGMFWKRASAKAAAGSMVTALLVVLFWYVAAHLGAGGIFSVNPLWPGFLVSAAVFFGICIFGRQSPEEKARIEVFMSHRS